MTTKRTAPHSDEQRRSVSPDARITLLSVIIGAALALIPPWLIEQQDYEKHLAGIYTSLSFNVQRNQETCIAVLNTMNHNNQAHLPPAPYVTPRLTTAAWDSATAD